MCYECFSSPFSSPSNEPFAKSKESHAPLLSCLFTCVASKPVINASVREPKMDPEQQTGAAAAQPIQGRDGGGPRRSSRTAATAPQQHTAPHPRIPSQPRPAALAAPAARLAGARGGARGPGAATAPRQRRPSRSPGFESCMCLTSWCLKARKNRGRKVGQVAFPRSARPTDHARQEAWLDCPILAIPTDCDCGERCDCTTVRPPPSSSVHRPGLRLTCTCAHVMMQRVNVLRDLRAPLPPEGTTSAART